MAFQRQADFDRFPCEKPVEILRENCGAMVQKNAWEIVKDELHQSLTSEAYQNWVARTSFLALEGNRLKVGVPDQVTRIWMESEYSAKVQKALNDLKLPVLRVEYELAGPEKTEGAPSSNGVHRHDDLQFPSVVNQLNIRLTFDSFVVGSCNQFAHAAARAVASSPARSYNPLFIYGGTGMGKTHLIHAVGHALLTSYSGLRVVYTSAERFMNEMVNCLKQDRMASFHQHYRTADVLLIDDVHMLANRERTQEEFFHTFNELYDHQKQIVLSSDALPKNTPGLVERLRSRFEWGLMVDIQPPDLETKMAILDKKSEAEGIRLPEDVRIFLAAKTKSNVRELEGALVKLLAYSSVTGSPITMSMAQQVLRSILPSQERRISIESVVKAVAERFSMQPGQLKQKTNAQEVARPRQIAMYLVKELTPASLPEIGRAFGGKHHTTVLHSIRKVESLRSTDPDINRLVHSLIDSFN
jgi:chromosomal replication initiator protein